MTQVSFDGQVEDESNGGDTARDNEERLKKVCSDVGDVGDGLIRGHRYWENFH